MYGPEYAELPYKMIGSLQRIVITLYKKAWHRCNNACYKQNTNLILREKLITKLLTINYILNIFGGTQAEKRHSESYII